MKKIIFIISMLISLAAYSQEYYVTEYYIDNRQCIELVENIAMKFEGDSLVLFNENKNTTEIFYFMIEVDDKIVYTSSESDMEIRKDINEEYKLYIEEYTDYGTHRYFEVYEIKEEHRNFFNQLFKIHK